MAGSADELTVYIVDDDPAVRNSLAVLVESVCACPVIVFDRGEAFLSATPRSPYLLVIDVRLPGISGVEVLEAISQGDASPPVVLITGHAELNEVDFAWYPNQLTLLEKPFHPSQILAVIESAMDSSSS